MALEFFTKDSAEKFDIMVGKLNEKEGEKIKNEITNTSKTITSKNTLLSVFLMVVTVWGLPNLAYGFVSLALIIVVLGVRFSLFRKLRYWEKMYKLVPKSDSKFTIIICLAFDLIILGFSIYNVVMNFI